MKIPEKVVGAVVVQVVEYFQIDTFAAYLGQSIQVITIDFGQAPDPHTRRGIDEYLFDFVGAEIWHDGFLEARN
ncbi:hypothetical protein D3C81_2136060 [compost metagenome]